ncbi:class I SAM-dependent methyltransferase [Candidatus Saccharibacteria bacterium]|nr:class I SAM-dependent methyltransferase [Candidatus Saccharibacteria bacterium]
MLIALSIVIIFIFLIMLYFSGSSTYMRTIDTRAAQPDQSLANLEDKYKAHQLVRQTSVPLPKLYDVQEDPALIRAPYPYILKTNHWAGGKGVKLIRNSDDHQKAIPLLCDLLSKRMTSERITTLISPRLAMAEEYIPNADDIKVYIFNGQPKLVLYIKRPFRYWLYPNYTPVNKPLMHFPHIFWKRPYPNKPKYWDTVLTEAAKLSQLHPELNRISRIDFLISPTTYRFGEFSFSSHHYPFYRFVFTPWGKKLMDQLSYPLQLTQWGNYIDGNLLPLMGNNFEGNIYTSRGCKAKPGNIFNVLTSLRPQNILEIGFNGGFSALLFKQTCPDAKLTCVDINKHPYVVPCFNRIRRDYPDIQLILESSRTAIPKLQQRGNKYDFIHIDGDHSYNGATIDMENCLTVSKPGTIILFDDTDWPSLKKVCNNAIASGLVREFPMAIVNGRRKHMFLEVL